MQKIIKILKDIRIYFGNSKLIYGIFISLHRLCMAVAYILLKKINGTNEKLGSPYVLENDSETCYMNAVFQILAGSSELRKRIKSFNDNRDSTSLRLLDQLLNGLNGESKVSSENMSTLRDLIKAINWTKPSQQDSYEMLSSVFTKLTRELNENGEKETLPLYVWLVYYSQIDNYQNRTEQKHLGLNIPLAGDFEKRPGEPLINLVDEYFSKNLIDDDPKKIAYHVLKGHQAPNLLLLHIQANRYDHDRNVMTKPTYYIKYTENMTFNLKMDNCQNEIKRNYRVVGVVAHSGSVHCGHYVAYRKVNNVWCELNDSCIREVEDNFVFNSVVPYIILCELDEAVSIVEVC